MADRKDVDQPTGTEKMGHEWDGIEELDTPLPRWWLWLFYATIIFSVAYVVAYPAFPMLSSASRGMLGWSSHGQLDQQLKADQQSKAATRLAIAQLPMDQIVANPRLLQAAVEGGRSVFKTSCVQCHGSGATGAKGYPNLNDDDWLWGGDIAAIHQTISHGVRQPGDNVTRTSQMLAFGRDQMLTAAQINDVASYVRLISGQQQPTAASTRGAKVFVDTCAACHGADGKGIRAFGAPNLTDVIWLYGGDKATIVETITNGRQGVMPAWTTRFDPVTVRMLAAYVYSLGGGEKQPVQPALIQEAKADGQP